MTNIGAIRYRSNSPPWRKWWPVPIPPDSSRKMGDRKWGTDHDFPLCIHRPPMPPLPAIIFCVAQDVPLINHPETDFAMPRRARLTCAGIPWHIIQRGNNRTACFYVEDDYHVYLHQLNLQAKKFGCALHAYCLMSNHVHLLLTPEDACGPSLMMKHLGQYYVQYINRTYKRSGTLWEGRFKSCLAQDNRYVLTCYGYIELNPVRAFMVASPACYKWSSFRCNALGETNALITPHPNYLHLGDSTANRCNSYYNWIVSQVDEDSVRQIRQATQGNYVLGDGHFQQEMALLLGRRVKRGKVGRPAQLS